MRKIDYKNRLLQWEQKHTVLYEIKEKLPKEEISVKINNMSDLFFSFDADEIEHRSLSTQLNNYLVQKTDNIEHLPNLQINAYIEVENSELTEENLKAAFVNHFEEKAIEQFRENRKLHTKWMRNFIIGLFFLGFCLLLAQIFSLSYFDSKPVFGVLRESLSIIGWVAIWEPAGYFLFGRKENNRLLRNYVILHNAKYNIFFKN